MIYSEESTMGAEGGRQDEVALRRRRVSFRCWHRGMREVDLLLGRFADAHLATLDMTELAAFEDLLSEALDRDVLAWVMGETAVPAEWDSGLLRRIIAFHGRTT